MSLEESIRRRIFVFNNPAFTKKYSLGQPDMVTKEKIIKRPLDMRSHLKLESIEKIQNNFYNYYTKSGYSILNEVFRSIYEGSPKTPQKLIKFIF
jgi:hypothetical protein